MKKKIIVLDTNVYGWYVAYTLDGSRKPQATDAFGLVSRLIEERKKETPKITVLATDRIVKEIKTAQNSNLERIFYSLVEGVIKKRKKDEELADEYFENAKKKKLRVDKEDCEIVASTVLSGTKWFVTENRVTINDPKVKEVIESVNSAKKLLTPMIISSKKAIGEILV